MKLNTFHPFLIATIPIVQSFAPYHPALINTSTNTILYSQNPFEGYNPGSAASDPESAPEAPPQVGSQDLSGEEVMKGNRWSKFAPDTTLSPDEFRSQLKENMKSDLERRRREDPNRGNQPAKNYLDSL